MSHSEFSGHDTAPYPPPPSFGSPLPELPLREPTPPDAGDDDDASWFQPVSYDQTDYQDLDAYLALDAEAGRPPSAHGAAGGEPAFPDLAADQPRDQAPDQGAAVQDQPAIPDQGGSAWESARARAGDASADRGTHADAGPAAYHDADGYADPDPYAYRGAFADGDPYAHRGAYADGDPHAYFDSGANADPFAYRDAGGHADPYAYAGADGDPFAYRDAGAGAEPHAHGGGAYAEGRAVLDGSPRGGRSVPDEVRRGRRLPGLSPGARRRPRWMMPAAVGVMAATVGAGAVIVMTSSTSRAPGGLPMFSPGARPASSAPALITPGAMTSGASRSAAGTRPASPGSSAPAALAAPISQAQAQQVLSHYTTVNNTANGTTSDSLIANVETGSSLAIDRGIYREDRAARPGGFPAFAPALARYYIPLQDPASYPHWFAVRVSNAPVADPATVTSREYLVFTQDQPGGPWLNALEPFISKDKAPPPIALDGKGFARAVSVSTSGLLLSPAVASGATAAALNAGAGQPANPGNLAIDSDRAAVARRVPGASVTARHSGTSDRVFALRTSGGGALLFYDVAARLTLTAPAGATLKLTIPGYLSAGEGARQATLSYLEQFATYDPPRHSGTLLPVIAGYSAITGRG